MICCKLQACQGQQLSQILKKQLACDPNYDKVIFSFLLKLKIQNQTFSISLSYLIFFWSVASRSSGTKEHKINTNFYCTLPQMINSHPHGFVLPSMINHGQNGSTSDTHAKEIVVWRVMKF